jgi:hypothetical protein
VIGRVDDVVPILNADTKEYRECRPTAKSPSDYLDHAQALERTKGFEPAWILGERLAPDMLTFGEQFSVSCNKVDAHGAKLMQRDPPPRTTATMYAALKGRLLETGGFLQNVQPDEIASAQSHI